MASTAFKAFAQESGGRVLLLLLLFLLAIYEFITAGFAPFAIVCMIPVLMLGVFAAFHFRMLVFWMLMIVNFLIQWKNSPLSGIPTSVPNEMLELILLALAIIDMRDMHYERLCNIMLVALLAWAGFCTLEVFNDTCDLGLHVAEWYSGARMMAYQLLYAFLV